MLGYLISPVLQVENTDGKPLVGGRIVVYRHGTTEPYITYKDFEGTHNPAEVILDSKGMCILIAEEGYSYDVYCRDKHYVEQWSRIGISIGLGGTSIISRDGTITVKSAGGVVDLGISDNDVTVLTGTGAERGTDGNFVISKTAESGGGLEVTGNRVKVKKAGWYHIESTWYAQSALTANGYRTIELETRGSRTKLTLDLTVSSEQWRIIANDFYLHADEYIDFALSGMGDDSAVRSWLQNVSIHRLTNIVGNPPDRVRPDWAEQDPDSPAYIFNKPNLAPVATTGSYEDLTDKPDLDIYATKVEGATEGNLAALDADGNLVDSGEAAANVVHDANYVHTDNNYTTEDKDKLAGIAAGAEVNVQADWTENDSTKDSYIQNKPHVPTVSGDGTSISSIDGLPIYAASATRATQDGVGNNIVDTYAKESAMSGKQDKLTPGTNISIVNGLIDVKNNDCSGIGAYGVAIGYHTIANGYGSFAQGGNSNAAGSYSHVEGESTKANGQFSHAEGYSTSAVGSYSHAEGRFSLAQGQYSHADGDRSSATGAYAVAFGKETMASGNYSLVTGNYARAYGNYSMAIGTLTRTYSDDSLAQGVSTSADGRGAHSEGHASLASATYAHAEGESTSAFGINSHAEGETTIANARGAHAEGSGTSATSAYAHAEGRVNIAQGQGAHAEGYLTSALDDQAHSEGVSTVAVGNGTHAEGYATSAVGNYSHAEGNYTVSNAFHSHAEGAATSAMTQYSHAEGRFTISDTAAQHVEGQYNAPAVGALHVIGNGTSNDNRSNIVETYTDRVLVNGTLVNDSNDRTLTKFMFDSTPLSQRTQTKLLIKYGPISPTSLSAAKTYGMGNYSFYNNSAGVTDSIYLINASGVEVIDWEGTVGRIMHGPISNFRPPVVYPDYLPASRYQGSANLLAFGSFAAENTAISAIPSGWMTSLQHYIESSGLALYNVGSMFRGCTRLTGDVKPWLDFVLAQSGTGQAGNPDRVAYRIGMFNGCTLVDDYEALSTSETYSAFFA